MNTFLIPALFVVGFGVVPIDHARTTSAQYPSKASLTPKDDAEIREVAKRAGISEIGDISVDSIHHPLDCFAVRVKSRIVVTGNKSNWSELFVVPVAAPATSRYCSGDKTSPYQSGGWTAQSSIVTHEEWTITERGWSFGVRLSGVTYETASRIVLALKNKTYVDRRKSKEPHPFGDSLLIGSSGTLSKEGDQYRLMMGSGGGLVVNLRVTPDAVEVLAVSQWVS
jgi:hypothetical protein